MVDNAIQELENEFLKIDSGHSPVPESQLHHPLSVLNSRIRNRGLSSREILFQRDQVTNEQININDQDLAASQVTKRTRNHLPSAKSKAPGRNFASSMDCRVGDLVFLKDERNKNKARDRYVVVSIEAQYAYIQNLTDRFMSRKY